MVDLTVMISRLILKEQKLAQGAFGTKNKMVHLHTIKILQTLLNQSKINDDLVKTEFQEMADKIEDLEVKLATLTKKNSKNDVKVIKTKKSSQNGLKRKLEASA